MAVDLYDVDLTDLEAHLPARQPFGPTSKPTATQANRFVAEVAATVAARVGTLDDTRFPDPDDLERVRTLARAVVGWGAASIAEAAAHPERVNPNDATAYSQWLWERYREQLVELVALVDALTPGTGAATDVAPQPAYSFPRPAGWARRGF